MKMKEQTDSNLAKDALEEKLAEQEIIRQAVEEKKRETEEYYKQLLRLRAEFDNYRKRVEKEKEKIYLRGKGNVLIALISLLDSLEQAEKNVEVNNLESVVAGLKLIQSNFRNFLKNEGVETIDCIGRKFDPDFHEVLEQEEAATVEEGTILEELQKGYTFNGEVIRPAKVKIAKNR